MAAPIGSNENTPLKPLPRDAFKRFDESPDEIFYETPRLVTHIDDAAIEAVTQLYREFLPEDGAILDLMSSWVSHLPSDVVYERVVGLGMNGDELATNRASTNGSSTPQRRPAFAVPRRGFRWRQYLRVH